MRERVKKRMHILIMLIFAFAMLSLQNHILVYRNYITNFYNYKELLEYLLKIKYNIDT